MFDHDHGVRARRQRSPRHDPYRLPACHQAHTWFRPIARLHLADNCKPRRNLRQIRRADGISVASGPSKGRKVTVRRNRFRENPAQSREQIDRLYFGWSYASRLLLDQVSSLFKTHYTSRRR
jgi:hypothetical protein